MQQLLSWRVHFTLLPALSCYLCCDSEVCECLCIVNDFSGKFYILYLKPHTLYIVHCVQFYCIYECNVVSYTNGVLFSVYIYIRIYFDSVHSLCVQCKQGESCVKLQRSQHRKSPCHPTSQRGETGESNHCNQVQQIKHDSVPQDTGGGESNHSQFCYQVDLAFHCVLRRRGEGNRTIVKQIYIFLVLLRRGESNHSDEVYYYQAFYSTVWSAYVRNQNVVFCIHL